MGNILAHLMCCKIPTLIIIFIPASGSSRDYPVVDAVRSCRRRTSARETRTSAKIFPSNFYNIKTVITATMGRLYYYADDGFPFRLSAKTILHYMIFFFFLSSSLSPQSAASFVVVVVAVSLLAARHGRFNVPRHLLFTAGQKNKERERRKRKKKKTSIPAANTRASS